MSNIIDLQGEGPVVMPSDLLGPFGFMSGALYKVTLDDWSWDVFITSFNLIANARDAMRAARHQDNMRFEELLANEAKRQASAAVLQHERDREDVAVYYDCEPEGGGQ